MQPKSFVMLLMAAVLLAGCGRGAPPPAAKKASPKRTATAKAKGPEPKASEVRSPSKSTAQEGTAFPLGNSGATSTDADLAGKLAKAPTVSPPTADVAGQPSPSAAPPGVAPVAAAQNGLVELQFIGEQYTSAIIIHPRRILQSPPVANAKPEEMLALFERETEFKLQNLERVTILFSDASLAAQEMPAVLLQFSRAIDPDMVLPRMGLHDFVEKDGLRYVVNHDKTYAGKPAARGRMLIFAPPERMVQLVPASRTDSPLVSRLRSADVNHDLVGIFTIPDSLRPSVREFVAKVREANAGGNSKVPAEVVKATEVLPDGVESALFTLDVAGSPLAQISISAKDEAAAGELFKALNYQVEQMRPNLKEEFGSGPERALLPPQIAELIVEPLLDVLAKLKLEVRGKEVVASVPPIEGLGEKLAAGFSKAGTAARLTDRFNNMKQLGVAFHTYHDVWNILPPANVAKSQFYDKNGKPLLSWRVHILPMMECQPLYDKFHQDEPWDSEYNLKLAEMMPSFYKTTDHPTKTTLMVFFGNGALYDEDQKGHRFGEIRDGMSKTIMVVEAGPDKAVPWTKPDDLPFEPKNPKAALGTIKEDFLITLMGDGSVLKLPMDIADEEFRALITRAGGEDVDPLKLRRK